MIYKYLLQLLSFSSIKALINFYVETIEEKLKSDESKENNWEQTCKP